MKTPSHITAIIICGISLLVTSCETYEYMRDPDAPRRAELLERNALLAEAESEIPPEAMTEDGLPVYGTAAYYNEFPEGTNPPATSVVPLPERRGDNSGESSDEYERWVIGPEGLLVPSSSLEQEDTPEPAPNEDAGSPETETSE